MRGLARFLLLCVGVTLLLAFCVVAYVTTVGILGLFTSNLGPWFLLGIPLAVTLLFGGMLLCMGSLEVTGSIEKPLERVFFGSIVVAFFTMLVAFVPGIYAGPQIYQKYYGEKTTAVVSSITVMNNESGGVLKYQYHVRDDATDTDLGILAHPPWSEPAEGDRIEVVVDPHGWVPPVAADQLGKATIPTIILAGCAVVVGLAAVTVLATALGVMATAGLRRRPTGQ